MLCLSLFQNARRGRERTMNRTTAPDPHDGEEENQYPGWSAQNAMSNAGNSDTFGSAGSSPRVSA